MRFASWDDRDRIENEMPWEARPVPRSIWGLLDATASRFPDRPAVSFQLLSGPKDPAETLSWQTLRARTAQAANLFRSLGIGEKDVVAYILPNATETIVTFLGGMVAGIVNPINPLLEPEQMAAILRESGARVVVTLKPFPKTDVPQKAHAAVALAPNVETVLEVDLNRYLTAPKSWIVPLIRPRLHPTHKARVLDFNREAERRNTTLDWEDPGLDRPAAYFHTGGTTGMPKLAQHRSDGIVYNGWLGATLLMTEEDRIMCPLPLFHVFACHVILMAGVASGAHVVFPTPAGYRGEGVFDNFWKLCERWRTTFIITVPTAIAQLMQRPVDADISTVKNAFSGSAPLPLELYRRFTEATGVNIVEGYGLTEATCLVSCNPVDGVKKVGSVGIPFPYTHVRIIRGTPDGPQDCGIDEVGEICVSNPGVWPGHTYTDPEKNRDLYYDDRYLRTGDLGRFDEDRYLWITGRAKDLIIRGGHNIDPALIEEALLGHESVAFAGAIGQPDARAGELPAVYVELVEGAEASVEDLMEFARLRIHERAAHPKYLEILPELPKTAVGKVFKPALRKLAVMRVYNAALSEAGVAAEVVEVVEDKKRGLLAKVQGTASDEEIAAVLDRFTRPWERA